MRKIEPGINDADEHAGPVFGHRARTSRASDSNVERRELHVRFLALLRLDTPHEPMFEEKSQSVSARLDGKEMVV